ncbi:MAG TPA: hypothetical protein VNI54_04875 [Thermoanaerobaculia bacterium]|nr:hypothetical protein [Thermoanaerobaculia bacterium]
MTRAEENRTVVLKTMAMGTSDARKEAQMECRRILSAGEGSIDFRVAVRAILTSISAPEPPARPDPQHTVRRLTTKLLESRGLHLNAELACELGEFVDGSSGPVSPAEQSLISLWIERHEAFSARRWRKLMERYARMKRALKVRSG